MATSTAIEASLDRRYSNHRFQRGLEPLGGTLSRPSPHAYAQAPKIDNCGRRVSRIASAADLRRGWVEAFDDRCELAEGGFEFFHDLDGEHVGCW